MFGLLTEFLVQFSGYIRVNVQLYSMRNGIDLSPPAVANYTRNELAKSLRKKPYQVGMLLGGIDPITNKPSLYWIDQYASLASLPYAAQGYGLYVTLLRYPVTERRLSLYQTKILIKFLKVLLHVDPR